MFKFAPCVLSAIIRLPFVDTIPPPSTEPQIMEEWKKSKGKIQTYPTSPRQRRIRPVIDIQMIHPHRSTPLLRADVRLAKVPRVHARATIDNLHHDTLTYAPGDLGAAQAAGVGHLIAGAAVACRAPRRGVLIDGD